MQTEKETIRSKYCWLKDICSGACRVPEVGLLTLQELSDLLEYESFVGRVPGETGG